MSTPGELLRAGGWRLGHHGGDQQQPYWEHYGRYPGVAFDVYAALADECHQLRADLATVTEERDLRQAALGKMGAELAETKAALEQAKRESCASCIKAQRAAQTEAGQLRRAWALWLLGGEWYDRDGLIHFTTSDSEGLPEDVRQLAMRYAGICIGPCVDCKARAPLKQVCGATMNDPDKLVCAWGCSEKGASDGGV